MRSDALLAKRTLDIVVAALGLIVMLPLIGVLALVTVVAHGRPVFFRQVRVGQGGETFTLFKFRTMTNERDASGQLLADDERLTRAGRIFRRFRLDELPSFLCVLAGKMSLVGPRPLPPYVLDTIPGSAQRHVVRPGFTGLAQVSGNTLLTNQEKLALDLFYVRNWSLAKDTAILLKTVPTILLGEIRDEPLIERAVADQQQKQSREVEHDLTPAGER
jgi:lipopolysaccharide/colanic/teichoic acid biosynthesis glycosyltransferase